VTAAAAARRRRPALAILALGAALLGPATAKGAPAVEYLYVEANEGSSSGGHVALRLGDRVFHFQHRAPGIVALAQTSYQSFRHQYADLENRSIEASRIDATDEIYARLVDRFTRRQVIQDQQLSALDGLRRDRLALEAMLDGAAPVEGAGFFFSDRGREAPTLPSPSERERARVRVADDEVSPAPPPEPAILALRLGIEAAHGPRFLAERAGDLRRELAALDPEALELPVAPLADDGVPPPTYGFAQRYGDVAAGLLALEVLGSARPIEEGVAVGDPGVALDPADVGAVRGLADALEARLVALVASSRPDWGPAALLGMARLVALRRTESTGTWTVLEMSSNGAGRSRRPSGRPDVAEAELARAGEAVEAARRRLFGALGSEQFPEAELAALERGVNRLVELRRAIALDRPARVFRGALPARPVRRPLLREISRDALLRDVVLVKAREEAYARELGRLYAYKLTARNCATELIREMYAAARADGRAAPSLDFIPAFSPSAVQAAFSVTDVSLIPSYRKRRLARMKEGGSAARVFVRESNTLTSTIYRRNPEDSPFLFFTDDTVAARPILGAANLLVGAGASVAGLAMLPADGGAAFLSGLRGVLWSLPELVFQNVRKGSFDDAAVGD
jgi:hypothetical protein